MTLTHSPMSAQQQQQAARDAELVAREQRERLEALQRQQRVDAEAAAAAAERVRQEEEAARAAASEADRARIRELENQMAANGPLTQGNVDLPKIHVQAVSPPKFPSFWREHPAAWFLQAEAIFTAHRITSDNSKFSHVVSSLDVNSFIDLQDIIQAPPAVGKYEHLKATAIARFSDSADRQIQTLLNGMQLGEQKPSQLLARMRSLANNRLSEDVLRITWSSQLPATVQPFLKALRTTELTELAALADRLTEGQANAVCASDFRPSGSVGPTRMPTEIQVQLGILAREIADLRNSVASLKKDQRDNRGRGRSRERNNSRHRQQNSGPPPGLCRFHHRFGEQAYRCVQPCNFQAATQNQGNLN